MTLVFTLYDLLRRCFSKIWMTSGFNKLIELLGAAESYYEMFQAL